MPNRVQGDPHEIQRAVDALYRTGDVVELRAFRHKRNTVSGYYDDPGALVRDAFEINSQCGTVYATLNQIDRSLLARRANRFVEYADQTTSDQHILRRRWLPIDLDPVRPSGISSTEQEHQEAISVSRRVWTYLVRELGYPEPLSGDSGNGAHILCRIDLPNSEEATQFIRDCLLALDDMFSSDTVLVDVGNFNAARIWKLYGTVAMKGDSTKDRLHRLAKLLYIPDSVGIVSEDQLRKLADLAPTIDERNDQSGTRNNSFDVQQWIDVHQIPVLYCDDRFHGRLGPGRKWVLECCLWNEEHTDKSAYIIQFNSGQIAAGCQHNSCSGKRWKDLRALVEGRISRQGTTSRPLSAHITLITQPDWPKKIDEAAFHGLAGEVVRAIEPHSEADPVALLVQFLTAFGNAAGRCAYFLAESDRHYMKLFVVLVGATSKGRKGTSWGHIRRLFRLADEGWVTDNIVNGLTSGEGLIWAVRDEIRKQKSQKKDDRIEYHEVISDKGVLDKRLLCLESEFASTLRVVDREGNTLSPVIRSAWDTGNLQTLTKNSPAKATGAHISIIGHITADELRRYLTTTEASNGFGNRFLWTCVERSKYLPEGGGLSEEDLKPLAEHLAEVLEAARYTEFMERDETTRQLWQAVYPELSDAPPGLFGSLTSRAEAQTMRLACLYALLDQSVIIRRPHLEAALAVWGYVESSARCIFGSSLGDPVADEILQALGRNPIGLSREDIRRLFSGHRGSNEIARSLGVLAQNGLAHAETVSTGGRPKEVWKPGEGA